MVVRHIDTVLREFGGTLADTVKLTAFYAAGDGQDEAWFIEAVAEACRANGLGATRSGPVLVPVPLPWLALPGMRVEIEAVAMLGEYGGRLDRDSASPDGVAELPAPFSHALRCGEHVFVGGQSAAGGDPGSGALAHERLADALGKLGATPADLVRLAAWYSGETPPSVRAADFERHVAPLECAYVELPAPRLAPEHLVRVDGWAVCPQIGADPERRVLRLDAPWRLPGRTAHVGGVSIDGIVFLSSQMALDPEGAVAHLGDLPAQTRLCVERTRALLEAAGLDLDHMVKQTSYFHGNADPGTS